MEQDYRGMEEARQVRHNAGSFSQCARAMLVGALQCLVRWFPRATHALEAQRMSGRTIGDSTHVQAL
jgi:hypothetical protein